MSRKRVGPLQKPRGVIDKPILGLLTSGSSPFWDVYFWTCTFLASEGAQKRTFPLLLHNESFLAVRESLNKSAASAASPDYVKFQAVIKSAASAASLPGGRASGRLHHGFFAIFGRASGQKYSKIVKISDSASSTVAKPFLPWLPVTLNLHSHR